MTERHGAQLFADVNFTLHVALVNWLEQHFRATEAFDANSDDVPPENIVPHAAYLAALCAQSRQRQILSVRLRSLKNVLRRNSIVRHRAVHVSHNIVVEPGAGAFSRITTLTSWDARPGKLQPSRT